MPAGSTIKLTAKIDRISAGPSRSIPGTYAIPSPAIVVMTPSASTRRMRAFPESKK